MKSKASQNCSPGALGTLPCLTTFLSGQGQCDLDWHLPVGLLPGDHVCPLHFSTCGHGSASLGSLALWGPVWQLPASGSRARLALEHHHKVWWVWIGLVLCLPGRKEATRGLVPSPGSQLAPRIQSLLGVRNGFLCSESVLAVTEEASSDDHEKYLLCLGQEIRTFILIIKEETEGPTGTQSPEWWKEWSGKVSGGSGWGADAKVKSSQKSTFGTSLVVQWLRICLSCKGHGFDPRSGKIPYAAGWLSPDTTTPGPTL